MDYFSKPKNNLNASIEAAPDKSISHRAVMFSAIADGVSEINNFLDGEDCIATINCFKSLGIKIEKNSNNVKVFGKGLYGLSAPKSILDVGNSGTTIRLLSGLLAAQEFSSCITGDDSIKKRPMGRVITPLRQMGAKIQGENGQNFAPLYIEKSKLKGITYHQEVASAQVKSAILLASLYAEGETKIYEPLKSRDHTELMLNFQGADIS
ncbi:MAG: 3-phosphoshikimate 1-carboxyvinyltransferase, partial [Clostridiales bacterium]|nr:3-phosphoshikimate 1-carboxyvinyltransferase [Clostridiales bacterium]